MEAPPTPEYYRSTVTGEVVHIDDLVGCERCDRTGEIALEWRDVYTKRLVSEIETCPTCNGHRVVEQRLTFGAHLPYAVEPLSHTSQI